MFALYNARNEHEIKQSVRLKSPQLFLHISLGLTMLRLSFLYVYTAIVFRFNCLFL